MEQAQIDFLLETMLGSVPHGVTSKYDKPSPFDYGENQDNAGAKGKNLGVPTLDSTLPKFDTVKYAGNVNLGKYNPATKSYVVPILIGAAVVVAAGVIIYNS